MFERACASAQALARQLTPELVLSQPASLGIEQKPLAAPKPVIEQPVVVSVVKPAGLVQRSYQAAAAASGRSVLVFVFPAAQSGGKTVTRQNLWLSLQLHPGAA